LPFEAAKKSKNRRTARSPASAIIAGTASALCKADVVTGAAVSTSAGTLCRPALTATPHGDQAQRRGREFCAVHFTSQAALKFQND
jgi:hypothetical protein